MKEMSDEDKRQAYKDICDIFIKASGGNLDELFDVVRLVWHNLQMIEINVKKDIRRRLFKKGPKCACCGGVFDRITGTDIEMHRKDDRKRYTIENCELVHKGCHQDREKRLRKRVYGLDNRIRRLFLGNAIGQSI